MTVCVSHSCSTPETGTHFHLLVPRLHDGVRWRDTIYSLDVLKRHLY